MTPEELGRYAIYAPLGAGGMATVHLGRLRGAAGFGRTVAIKRMHPHLAGQPELARMFFDEARLASRIRHPNVVPTLDVVAKDDLILIVMEYVHGEALGTLLRSGAPVPFEVAIAVTVDLLEGLHAAHEARTERGEPLRLVHRDVSPQNVLVGADGVARVLDFGIAKAERRLNETGDVGRLKGKTGYMAPEHILGDEVDRRADVYAAGIVLWELLVGRRLFEGSDATRMDKALCEPIPRPGTLGGTVPSWMDDIVMCALAREREARFQSAKEMADALESRGAPARPREVAAWVEALAGDRLAERSKLVEQIEAADRAMEPAEPPQTDATVTVTDGNPRRDGSPRRRSLFVAAAIGAVALAAIAVRFGLASRGAPRDPAPATVSAPVALTASEPAPITPASPDTATPPATAPSRPPSRVSGAARHRTAVPSPNCTPPYTVRADGIHVPKPECLGSR